MNKMNIVFLTGAGISAPAGIPTFQELYGPVLTGDESDSVKEILMEEIAKHAMSIMKTKHYTSTPMHMHVRNWTAKRYAQTIVFTTNVDSLHEQVGVNAYHIHGTMDDPVLFGAMPRFLEEFNLEVSKADRIVVIGSALVYPYLSMPITEWSMKQKYPALLLDTDSNHPLRSSFQHVMDELRFPKALDQYILGNSLVR